jgi:hypothetical protein
MTQKVKTAGDDQGGMPTKTDPPKKKIKAGRYTAGQLTASISNRL